MSTVRDVMTNEVMYIESDTSIQTAAERMRAHDVGALPVVHEDRVVGMVTDRDIVVRGLAEGCSPRETHVDRVMSEKPVFCHDGEGLREVAERMKEHRVRRLVVLDGDEKLAGVCSLGDIATATSNEIGGDVLSKVSEPTHA